jgi:hypothetical protein
MILPLTPSLREVPAYRTSPRSRAAPVINPLLTIITAL